MKIRFDRQSIRLRLRRSDIDQLMALGFTEVSLEFPTGKLNFRLTTEDFHGIATASFQNGCVLVQASRDVVKNWAASEEVGIQAQVPVETNGRLLDILIEKDFPCKHGSVTDNNDTFGDLAG